MPSKTDVAPKAIIGGIGIGLDLWVGSGIEQLTLLITLQHKSVTNDGLFFFQTREQFGEVQEYCQAQQYIWPETITNHHQCHCANQMSKHTTK